MAENRRDVVVRFLAQTGQLEKGSNVVQGSMRGVATSLKGIASLGAVVAGINFFKGAIEEAEEAERVGRKTEAVVKSTGRAANVTAGQVGDLAGSLSELAGVDDEVIQQGENVLLTFTKVRNETGKGNDIFNQASARALDMAAALDKTGDSGAAYQENVIRLGKALNDPIAGLTALKKVGVSFTDAQKDQIKTMTEAGDVAGAQKIILAELQTEFGGAAEANATASGKAAVAWGNFAETVGMKVLPAVTKVGEWLTGTGIPALGSFADEVEDVAGPALGGLVDAGGAVVDVWNSMPSPIQAGVVALGAWRLMGDRVTGSMSGMSGGVKALGSDVKTAMGAFDVNAVTGTFMALEERIPVVSRMGTAFRETSSLGIGLGTSFGGLTGAMTTFGAVTKGVGAASLVGLKAAAAGAMSMLGGPFGLALAGVTLGLTLFANRGAAAEAKQRALSDASRDVAKALREENNELNRKTRASAASALEEAGLLELAEKHGVNTGQLTDAYLGNNEARKGVNASIKGQIQALQELEAQQVKKADHSGAEQDLLDVAATRTKIKGLQELKGQIDGAIGTRQLETAEIERTARASQQEAQATVGSAQAKVLAMGSEESFRGTLEATGLEYDENKTRLENLLNALKNYNTEVTGAQDSEEGWFASLDALKASAGEFGSTLDITTAAGRNNRDALEEMSGKTKQLYLDQIAAGVSVEDATVIYNRNMQQVYDTAGALGFNAEQAGVLIEKYGGIPKNVVTEFSAPGYDEIYQKIQNLSAAQVLGSKGMPLTPSNMRAVQKDLKMGAYAEGGLVGGSGGPRQDNVHALLSPREVVQSNAAGDYYGRDFLLALNERKIPRGMLPGFADGGMASWPFPMDVSKFKIPTPPAPSGGSGSVVDPGSNAAGKLGEMQAWARAQSGKRYLWGAVGPGQYDCSGLVGNLYAMAYGLPMYRRYMTTAAMGPGRFNMDPGPGTVTVYLGPGHTAANVGGLHAEAYGGNGTPNAIGRIGTPLSYYNRTMHLRGFADGGLVGLKNSAKARAQSFAEKGWPEPTSVGGYRNGGWLMPGQAAINETHEPEAIFNKGQLKEMGQAKVEKHHHLTVITQAHQVDVPLQFARMEAMEGM